MSILLFNYIFLSVQFYSCGHDKALRLCVLCQKAKIKRKEWLVRALTILSVYMRIALKCFTPGQSCGYTRKQLLLFVTIIFMR